LQSQDLAEIVDILTKEIDLLRKLHTALENEQDALVRGDVEGIRGRVEGQIEVIKGLAALEQERKAAFRALCPDEPSDSEIRMDRIIGLAGEEHAGNLNSIRETMREVLKSLGQVNKQNDVLIRQSMSYVDRMLRALAGESAGSEVYDARGDLRCATGRVAVDHEA
jgi:flagellar biosynthesis/type III secretory pathway chaperone